jgi:chromosome segregation ATPase
VDRRAGDRRARDSRVDVTRLEHEQLQALVEGLTEAIARLEQDLRTQLVRIAQLQQEVNQLKARTPPS